MNDLHIRLIEPQNELEIARLNEICLQTGASGKDATSLYQNKDLIGAIYVEPYARFQPDYAYVLVDGNNVIQGYAVGTPDTASFEERLASDWWPQKQQEFPLENYSAESASPDFKDHELVSTIHNPSATAPEVADSYPAHFHINLLPSTQGSGNGRRLLGALLDGLKASGVSAVHLGVAGDNAGGIAFYSKLGFEKIVQRPWGWVMAKPL